MEESVNNGDVKEDNLLKEEANVKEISTNEENDNIDQVKQIEEVVGDNDDVKYDKTIDEIINEKSDASSFKYGQQFDLFAAPGSGNVEEITEQKNIKNYATLGGCCHCDGPAGSSRRKVP